jgi:CHAD domain-containing protein
MIEDEIKLSVPGPFTLPDLGAADGAVGRLEPAGQRTLRATYWDTVDMRLARNHVTLRHRTGESAPPWQLKLPVPHRDPGVREELAERGPAGDVPGPLRALVTGWVRTAELRPVATLRTERQVYLVRSADDDQDLAELVDDTVSIVDGRRVVARFREIEVERRAADDGVMDWLRDQLVAAGAVQGEFAAKVTHALGPLATEPSDLPEPPDVKRGASAASVVAYSLASGVRRLIAHDAPVRRAEPDAVHQMRVACRRLRSDLRTFRPLVEPDWAQGLRDELKWLGSALGPARDLEVLRARLGEAAKADPLALLDEDAVGRVDAILASREEQALVAIGEALGSLRYVELLERVVEAARHPAVTAAAGQPATEALTRLVATAWRKLAKSARALQPDASDGDWHAARIRAKRARYAAEASAPALGKPASRLGKAASSLQDLLGGHQDAVVAAQAVLDVAGEHPDDLPLVLACGRLAERERAEVRVYRKQFPTAWKAASSPKITRWLSA